MSDSAYDAVIVGGGIAGLSAAIHAGRSGLRCLLVERMMPGGQIFNATHIENMPGIVEPVSGVELSERLHDQAAQAGVEIVLSEVTGLEPDGSYWLVHKYDGEVRAKTVIIAAGSSFKKLDSTAKRSSTAPAYPTAPPATAPCSPIRSSELSAEATQPSTRRSPLRSSSQR